MKSVNSSTENVNEVGVQGYTDKLKIMLDSINALLATAHEDGIYFGLYMISYQGGDASTYGATDGIPGGDDASLTRVCSIEIEEDLLSGGPDLLSDGMSQKENTVYELSICTQSIT